MTLPPFWWQGQNSCGKVIKSCGKFIIDGGKVVKKKGHSPHIKMTLPPVRMGGDEKKRVTLFFWDKCGKDINLLARTCRECGKDIFFFIYENDFATLWNDLATPKNDLAMINGARSLFLVARSFQSVARTLFMRFVHTFARNLSWDKKGPNTPKKCICHTKKWPCHLWGGKVI